LISHWKRKQTGWGGKTLDDWEGEAMGVTVLARLADSRRCYWREWTRSETAKSKKKEMLMRLRG
jgi:hypothetical protein